VGEAVVVGEEHILEMCVLILCCVGTAAEGPELLPILLIIRTSGKEGFLDRLEFSQTCLDACSSQGASV
jgi:hypothetical protein